jgi:hypothetical protein
MSDLPEKYLDILNERMINYLPKQVTFLGRLWFILKLLK